MTAMQPRPLESVEELLHRDHYTPDQLASLLGVSPELIVHEAHEHRLNAYIINHQVVDICRDDVVRWLEARG